MPDDWKDDIEKKLDEAKGEGDINGELYDALKEILEASGDIAEFADAVDEQDILQKLTRPQQLGWKGFGAIVSILVTLIEAGPCPWTGIIAARLNRLREEALLEGQDRRLEGLTKLHAKYTRAFVRCSQAAYGRDFPKDINVATIADLTNAGLDEALAKALITESQNIPFYTPLETLRVAEMDENKLRLLFSKGFVFGFSGLLVLDKVDYEVKYARTEDRPEQKTI